MATTHTSTVTALYLAFYGRPADPAGLSYWAEQLAKADGNIDAIKAFFANSEEAQVRFGSDTAAERVTQIYQQLFNRAPEADGLAYWVDVISKGHASVADVAITILKGAQKTDLDLSTLRQQASDAFTTQVAATGSAYNGIAAVETARVLVQAVTAGASASEVDALVKSTMTLTSVASTTPEVIEAIGSGDQLLALLNTAQSSADTVAVVETLAEAARGASSDAHLLASLVKGGGMHNLLKVLPAGMSIKDLKATMDKGGLPAALKALNLDVPARPGKPDQPGSGDGDGDGAGAGATLGFELAATPDKLVLKAGTDAVTALANAAGLKLEDMSSGTAKATAVNYLDGVAVESGALVFKTELAAGLYQMSWTADSLATASGHLAAGSALFAGGQDGVFVQEGFAITKSITITGDMAHAGTELLNQAFIDDGSAKASIATGGGQDLVADNGGTLAIVYETFDGAGDLILGFDSGNDTVVLKGEAAAAVDGNADGKLAWASAQAVEATTEAISVTVDAQLVMGDAAALAKALAALDVSKVAANGELLILAKDAGDAAALFLYVNKNGDAAIDADELTQIAMFADGAPGQEDIVLVGTQPAPAA